MTARDAPRVPAAAAATPPTEPYLKKVIEYIPAEVVLAYQTGAGIIAASFKDEQRTPLIVWIVFLFVFAFAWTAWGTREKDQPVAWFQATVAAFAFLVWVFAIGGEILCPGVNPAVASLLLIAVSMVIPLLEKIVIKP